MFHRGLFFLNHWHDKYFTGAEKVPCFNKNRAPIFIINLTHKSGSALWGVMILGPAAILENL
jgi:hypothetical protein